MTKKNATGPLSRDEFVSAVGAPFGGAAEIIRQYDPLWGRREGEKIEWRVEYHNTADGLAYVKAASKEEAERLADELTLDDIEWDDEFEIISVEPAKPPKKKIAMTNKSQIRPCPCCDDGDAQPEHLCPYAEDVLGIWKHCECCTECEEECCRDI